MVKQIPVSFKNHRGLTLRGVVHVPKKYDTAIVYLHGFPGHKGGTTKRFCTALSRHGYLCLRFDFSGTGESEGAFEHKLMSEEVKDTKAAIDFITKRYPSKKLVLIGHSTGAIDAALYAHKDRRVRALVLSGGISRLDEAVRYDFTDAQVREFWKKGYTHVRYKQPWMKKNGKIYKAFYDEFFTLDIPKAMKKYRRPLLILHGSEDEGVPVHKDAKELYALARKPKKLVIIKGADHRFTRRFRPAVQAIVRFIRSV